MPNSIEKLFDQIVLSHPDFEKSGMREPEYPPNEEPFLHHSNDNDVAALLSDEVLDDEPTRFKRGVDDLNAAERDLIDGGVRYRGVECLAFYKSRRHLDRAPFPGKWGIFYLRQGLVWVASEIERYYPGYGVPIELATEFLRRHERFHFQFDVQVLQWEGLLGKALYEPLRFAYARHGQYLVEEALANREAWKWAKEARVGLREFAEDFLDTQPAAYARYREPIQTLAAELAANLVDRDYRRGASRSDVAGWIGLVPAEMARKSLCPEYIVRPAHLYSWIPHQLVIPPVRAIDESDDVARLLTKRYQTVREKWNETCRKLLDSPNLLGLNFKPWNKGLWSVRVNDNFRAHLRHHGDGRWVAEEIGPHTAMGHGL